MSYPRYPTYKDSGVEWLGDIPAHWQRKRLKFVCEINPSKSEIYDLPKDTLVSFVPMERIGENGSIDVLEKRTIGQLAGTYTYFREGDVLVAKITPCFENGKGTYCKGLENGIGLGSTEFHVLRPNENADSHFIFYLTYSAHFREQGTAAMYGAAGQQRVPSIFVMDFPLGLPPLPEQRAIAAFLDAETARIDALIAKQQALIALLHEKRKALISHAVTKGLDASAPMKDSGVPWLGEVPVHWDIMPLKRCLSDIVQGWSPECEDRNAGTDEWGVLKTGCVNRGIFRESEHKTLPGNLQPRDEYEIKSGDVLMSRANGSIELLGSVGLVRDVRPKLLLSDKIYRLNILPNIINNHFLVWIMNSRSMRLQIEQAASGAEGLANNIAKSSVREFGIVVPSLNEQVKIVQYLEVETSNIDTLIAKAEQFIELLREHRTALIAAAVTGKIDVRGLAGGGEIVGEA